MTGWTIYALLSVGLLGCTVSFILGWILGRRKFSKQTAVLVIENLKATIEVYKITHEEQMVHLSQKYTDLKIEVLKCVEENKVLKEEINKLKDETKN